MHRCLLIFITLIASSSYSLCAATALDLQDNDTIVFLGNTVIERAQKYGHLETALTLATTQKNLKFRNLGWSGDSVLGTARSYFGPPSEGFRRLRDDLTELQPNIVFLCYGAVAAHQGPKGLNEFISGYSTLIKMINSAGKPRQIILLTPPPAENLGAPYPDLTSYQKNLQIYRNAINELAQEQKLSSYPLTTTSAKLTDNGIHYTSAGYQNLTQNLLKSLQLPERTTLTPEKISKLRDLIIAKNKLFFFRWRPANETYLRLFRKYEQGNNAKELPMFDPLIEEKEKEIEAIKQAILTK